MNRELLQAIYDHRAICTAVEQRQEERALELWAEKARLLREEEAAERSAMLEALSQSLYDHILRVQGNAPAEFRHASREMYTRTLPQKAEEPFEVRFRLDDKGGLTAVLAGSCIMAASGVMDLLEAVGGSAAAVSADGMEIVATGTGGSGVAIGVLSVVSGVCLAAGTILCRRKNTPPLIFLAAPVCLLARLILVYRLRSTDPVLADYYLEILGLMFLILATYRLSGFAVQAGRPRIFTLYGEAVVILALTMLPDGAAPAMELMLGGALALTGFQMMLEPGPAHQSSDS